MGDGTVCGIIMPISEIDGCSERHWLDVKSIISSAIVQAGFTPNLVSDANESGVIQQRIIENLYSNELVVCDVSAKSPNCMFELGMRLAFDRPTIIVKDNKTPFSFDTSVIEHILYPRDLNFFEIKNFTVILTEKIKSTYSKAREDKHYSTFLSHFGAYKTQQLREIKVTPEYKLLLQILDRIEGLDGVRSLKEEKEELVRIDISELSGGRRFVSIDISRVENFRDFLDSVYHEISFSIQAFTYEFDWVLIDEKNDKVFESQGKINNVLKGTPFQDFRKLSEVGIFPGMILKVKLISEQFVN